PRLSRITEIEWSMTTRAAIAAFFYGSSRWGGLPRGGSGAEKGWFLHFHSSSSSLYHIEF
ncbi:hypothetical protein NLO34_25170, partial [Escherichia coli]|nr:hypothetical protein [Escherichia coli]